MQVVHDENRLMWIKQKMSSMGITDYRFCKESNCYVCDKHGNFFSVCRVGKTHDGKSYLSYRFIPIFGTVEDGYAKIRVNVDGKRKHINAHRMMLNAWVGERNDLVINHIDGNKLNNSLDNLEYCTVAQNNEHAIKHKLYNPADFKSRRYVIPAYDWLTLYVLNKHLGYSYRELGRMNGVSRGAVETVCSLVERMFSGVIV